MNFDLIVQRNNLFMDSRDIAVMVGKRHTHVLRDIDRMLEEVFEGEGRSPKNGTCCISKSYINSNNVEAKYYLLDYELTMTLITGYSVRLRNQIIKRWMYLEKDYRAKRTKSIDVRNHFTDTLKEHGYTKAHHYIQTTRQMKRTLGIANKKQDMSAKEIQAVKASEALAELLLDDQMGYSKVNPVCVGAAVIVADAVRKRGKRL